MANKPARLIPGDLLSPAMDHDLKASYLKECARDSILQIMYTIYTLHLKSISQHGKEMPRIGKRCLDYNSVTCPLSCS